MMAVCRVYFFTYKRHEMLERSIKSLLNQSFTDWVCEVHNDFPEDTFPERYINSLNDKRFIIKNHKENFGTTKSFNYAFKGCDEKYVSMLEDDNWWEPDFLAEMIAIMEKNPAMDIVWSNMKLWIENDDHSWSDSGKTIWPTEKDILFKWPNPLQAIGCVHSTGAMLYRGVNAKKYEIPDLTLSNAVELVRERCFKHPIMLSSKILANFSQTIETSQSKKPEPWIATQIMLLASFIKNSNNQGSVFRDVAAHYRGESPSVMPIFFLSIIFYQKKWRLMRCLKTADWYFILRWLAFNFFRLKAISDYLKERQIVWEFLQTQTKPIDNIYK